MTAAMKFGDVDQNPMLKPARRRQQAVRRSWALRALVARQHADWRTQAACTGRPELFHSGNNTRLHIARAVCETCPVRLDCLAACWAAESGINPRYWQGTYGGLTANERRDAIVSEKAALSLAEHTRGATLAVQKNEGRASACDAIPSPLDAKKERRPVDTTHPPASAVNPPRKARVG